jgi:UDP-glucose 4-epimerase
MKATVFGGSGFLGSHVCDKLSDAGHEVTIFDIKPSPWLRLNQKMMIGDILDEALVDKAVSGAEVVFNFAGIADIDEAKGRPIDTVRYNVLGNTILLETCKAKKIKRFVFASSVYVYSQSGAFYRASKQACETYIETYHELYNMEFTILRYGTLYGPRSDEKNAILRYIKQALKEGIIEYSGDVNAKREYIHVEDAAKASVEILRPDYANQHIVLTGNQSFKVKELFGMIQEILHKPVEIRHQSKDRTAHYILTPYNFSPRMGRKFIPALQIDLGQGLLRIVEEVYQQSHPELNNVDGFLVEREK